MPSRSVRCHSAATALIVLISCAPTEPASRQEPAATSSSGAEQAVSAAAPSTAGATQAEVASGGAPGSATPPADLESYMVEHFVIVTYARDAIIMGNVVELRDALRSLADYKYDHVTPGDWRPWVTKLQAAARPGATAKTLLDASQAIANTAAVCGECHAARKSGPQFPTADEANSDSGLSNTLSDRMERHVWAANRMWEGLIAPSDAAWNEGAGELASVPLKAPKERPALPPAFIHELRDVRGLGAQARRVHDVGERAAIYARFLTTCAQCHERELRSTF